MDKGTIIEREIFIAAPPEVVFAYFVDPALMAPWFGLTHVFEPLSGGAFRVEVSRGNVARGAYVQVEPPHYVAFTFGWESHDIGHAALAELPPGASLVEIALVSHDGGTLV
jgi:uncharacterized protein YndB with AHSA1/START domain